MDTSKKNLTICSENLAEIREKLCKNSTNILAEKTGLTPQIVSNIISGRRGIGRKTADRIIAAFPEVSTDWFFKGEGPMLVGGDATIAGDNSQAIIGNGNHHNTNGSTDERLLAIIEQDQRERLELLAIIKQLTAK